MSQTTLANNRCNDLGKGVNLSSWLEAHWLGNNFPNEDYFTKKDFESIAKLGFNSVRLPVSFERVFNTNPPYLIEDENHPIFHMIDSVIAWTEIYDLKVIIDNQHGWPLNDSNYLEEIPRLTAVWTYIAKKYIELDKDRIFFELRNEPFDISNDNLHVVFDHLIHTLRSISFDFTLIVGANEYNSLRSLINSQPYTDNNIIYSFHFYDPYTFTHQGLSWTGLDTGIKFHRIDEYKLQYEQAFKEAVDWSYENGVPIMIGEMGVGSNADLNSRCNWIATIMESLEAYKIPWFYWDIKQTRNSFGFFEGDIMSSEHIIPCFAEAMHLETPYEPSCHGYSLNLYPNPSTGNLTVNLHGLTEIGLYDMRGKLIKKYKEETNSFSTMLHDIQPGMYIVKCKLDDRYISGPWIKL